MFFHHEEHDEHEGVYIGLKNIPFHEISNIRTPASQAQEIDEPQLQNQLHDEIAPQILFLRVYRALRGNLFYYLSSPN